MRQNFRSIFDDHGFTLIELLVVMVILGVLAAIAVPAFWGQNEKAKDAEAKGAVATAKTAMEVYAAENENSYADASLADLIEIEQTLEDAGLDAPVTGQRTYTVQALSATGTVFSIARLSSGALDLDCAPRNSGGCPADGDWD